MKKKIVSILIIMTLMICLTGGSSKNEHKEPPYISITIDNQEIDYIIGKNQWNGLAYDREDTFNTILKEDSNIEIPYIELGKTAIIYFENDPPETIKVYDNLIDENGNNKYTDKEIIEVEVEIENGKSTFDIDEHWAAFLSSNSSDYEKGRTWRGFRMICSWGDNECEYAFIIKTDAK